MFHLEKNFNAAINYYEHITFINKNSVLLVKLGKCYEKLNNEYKAIDQYKKSIEITKDFVWGMFHLGWILCRKEDKGEGIKVLKRVLELDPTNNEIVIKLCDILFENEETVEEGLKIIKASKEKVRDINVDLLICEAKGYDKIGNFEKAVFKLEQAYKFPEFQNDAEKLFLLAQEYQKVKNFSKASQTYKAVLSINQNHIPSLYHLSNILIQTGEYLRAEKYYKHALKVNNQLSFAYFGLGKIYQSLKKSEEAIEEYTNCIKNDPENYK